MYDRQRNIHMRLNITKRRPMVTSRKPNTISKTEGYQYEAAYYTKKGDTDTAKDYTRRAERAKDDYKTLMRYAANVDDKATDYLCRV